MTDRLRRQCAHGRYEEHWFDGGFPEATFCPGGEFLPEGALVIENFTWTIRCASCETANCHAGINGGHDGPNNPPVHTRDIWVLTDLTEEQAENWDPLASQVGESK